MIELEPHQIDLRYASLRRSNPDKERRLLGSLAEIGQQMPVIVVQGQAARRYILIDGYKRMRCLLRLSEDTVRATPWQLAEADALMLVQLLRRSEGDSPLEQGWLLLELQGRFGLSQNELARRFSVSGSWVSRRLALVKQLPEFVHREVSQGRIGAHAAQKYLAPLARANRTDAEALCKAIAPLKLPSRQVGTLYAGYAHADDQGRALIVNQPELYLRTQAALDSASSEVSADPLAQLFQDADTLIAVAQRLRELISGEIGMRLFQTKADALKPCVTALRATIDALRSCLNQETIDA